MATRLKTIEFAVPQLNTLVDNTLTALTTIKAYIPEFSGTVTIKKAIVKVSIQEGATQTTGNYTSRRIDVSVGGAGATSYTNSNLYTGSGENTCVFYEADATAHFVSNWTSGTSKDIAISVLIDGTATTLAWVNVGATIEITFEYDDSQTTQIKTVYIPLDAPVGTLATSKPGSANATIPALDTELPEASKVIRSMFVVAQGNINNTASATDSTLSMQIDSLTAYTSQTIEMGATSDYWARFVWATKYYDSGGTAQGLGMDTSTTHGFYIWASVARHNHTQAYLVVTYEYDASASNNCFNSLLLPLNKQSIIGGSASTDFERFMAELYIEEPATITTKQLAAFLFWEQAAAISTLQFRLGTGSFVTYTDAAAVMCGGNGAMVRNDSAYTLARGKNTLVVDAYRTDTADFGWGLDGFLIVNYVSGKPTQGYGAANHTVKWNAGFTFDGATATNRKTSAFAVSIPESSYFINGFGAELALVTDSTGQFHGGILLMEKTNAAGQWETVICTPGHTDAETGIHYFYGSMKNYLYRWASDPDTNRLDPEGTRRYSWQFSSAQTGFLAMDLWITYHTITFSKTLTITGSAGSTVNIYAHRKDTGELVATGSRTGNGDVTLSWYDSSLTCFADAREDATHVGRSEDFSFA